MAYWCASIPWIVYVVTRFGGQGRALGVASLAILAAILAEWPALVAWGTVAASRPRSRWRLPAFVLLWTAAEHARSHVYGGFPWNLTGWALARHPIWIQSASVWGVYGVGALVVTVGALVAAAIARRNPKPLAGAAAVVLLTGGAGALRLAQPAARASGPTLSVELLQPNISQEERLDAEREARNYVEILARLRESAARRPGLIVLPESAFPIYWEQSPRLQRDLTEASRACGCPILFNDVSSERDGAYSNAARLLTPSGLAAGIYRKVHLVPFGEYVPLPRLFFFVRQISTEIGEFTPAAFPVVIRSGELALGVGVCYEVIYPSLARRQVSDGANLLATISNDSWYGRAGAQEQHLAGALFRAVENGRFLVRAAITGISGVVEPGGRIAAELPANRAGTVRANVRLLAERTVWTRWGHALPLAADALGAGVLLFGVLRWARERRATVASTDDGIR